MTADMERPPTGGNQSGGRKSADRQDPDSVRDGGDTSGQLTLDDAIEASRRRRDAGMKSATYGTDVRWVRVCDQVIRGLAESGQEFDAEVVRRIVGAPIGSPSAMGGRFHAAAAAGIIVPVGYRTASRPEAHGRVLRTWRGTS